MNFTFEIFDVERDMRLVFNNLTLDMLHTLSKAENIEKIIKDKYYMHGEYEHITAFGFEFIILKVTKKNVIMLNISA